MDKDSSKKKIALNSIGSLFEDSWSLYKERFNVFAEILLLPLLSGLLGYILSGLGFPFSALGELIIALAFVVYIYSILPLVFSLHNESGVDASYKATVSLFWPFVWITILEIAAILGGFIMLVIPGIWLSFSFSLVGYVLVIENRRGLDALRQSKDYIKGYWWAFLGRSLLLGIIVEAIVFIVQIPSAILGGVSGEVFAELVTALFVVPFSLIYSYMIYKNLRERKPELVDAQTTSGKGFITASAIVGIVVPAIIIIASIIFTGVGIYARIK